MGLLRRRSRGVLRRGGLWMLLLRLLEGGEGLGDLCIATTGYCRYFWQCIGIISLPSLANRRYYGFRFNWPPLPARFIHSYLRCLD